MYQCLDAPQSNIVISVILTDSATKILDLTCTPLEKLAERNNSEYILRPLHSVIKYFKCNVQQTDCDYESDVPYLCSTQFRTTSEESLLDVEIKDDKESAAEYYINKPHPSTSKFQRFKVFTRQLLQVQGATHTWIMKNSQNNLCLSIRDSKNSVSVTGSVWSTSNVCRICHGGESVANLVQPCDCKGSIAYVHLSCLERWLKESAYNQCELCQRSYQIIREPKYNIPLSIFFFLRHPGDHLRDLVYDGIAFLIYTPSAVISTYMLMLICESVAKNSVDSSRSVPSHVIAFSAIFGMAAIDFTYSSWLILSLQKHMEAWKIWYRNNCHLKVILPEKIVKRCIDRTQPKSETETDRVPLL